MNCIGDITLNGEPITELDDGLGLLEWQLMFGDFIYNIKLAAPWCNYRK